MCCYTKNKTLKRFVFRKGKKSKINLPYILKISKYPRWNFSKKTVPKSTLRKMKRFQNEQIKRTIFQVLESLKTLREKKQRDKTLGPQNCLVETHSSEKRVVFKKGNKQRYNVSGFFKSIVRIRRKRLESNGCKKEIKKKKEGKGLYMD